MRLLLCLPSPVAFHTAIDYLNQHGSTQLPKKTEDVQYLYSTRFLQHDVDVAFIGESLFEVNYKITKAIQQKYHLALKVGFCSSLKADLAVGTVVNVIKEKPLLLNAEGQDVYEAGMLNANDYPHFKGAFVNMNNSYMNVFLDLKKVVSGTLTSIPQEQLQAKYALDTITANGIGFVYPCMFERQPFYQVNVVNRNLVTAETDEELAQKVINEVLIDILQKFKHHTMNQAAVDAYIANQEIQAQQFIKRIKNPFLFRLFLLIKLPMAFLASVKVKEVNADVCEISVPFRWMNQNPFGSTYFAVLAMAAEMSSGMIALMYTQNAKPSIAMLVTNLDATFIKKATGVTTFKCESGKAIREAIQQSVLTGEGRTITCKALGYSKTGEVEAEFNVTWSFKARTK